MAAGRWSNQQPFAVHLWLRLGIINKAVVKTIKPFIFNRLQLSADGTQNTATTPSRNVSGNFMTDLTNTLEDIRDIFSILHDGRTSTCTGDKKFLSLKVNCEYLAEQIDKSFKSFYVECRQIDKIELHPWMNPIDLPQILLTEIKDIFKAELEILSAEVENDLVKITCSQHNLDFDYCGGTLLLNCKEIKIFDQTRRHLTIEEFDKISNDYWNSRSNELEQRIIGKNKRK